MQRCIGCICVCVCMRGANTRPAPANTPPSPAPYTHTHAHTHARTHTHTHTHTQYESMDLEELKKKQYTMYEDLKPLKVNGADKYMNVEDYKAATNLQTDEVPLMFE